MPQPSHMSHVPPHRSPPSQIGRSPSPRAGGSLLSRCRAGRDSPCQARRPRYQPLPSSTPITLVGLIAKGGILIVQFANQRQAAGLSKLEALRDAAATRLRPVLMTTAALVFAMIPLLIASGPGAASRFSMGMVIASGMTIGTMFTLFVLPAFYLYLARDHAHDRGHERGPATVHGDDAPLPPPEPQRG